MAVTEGEAPKLKVKKESLAKAVRALLQLVAKKSANANPLFGANSETMTLLVQLAQIPDKRKMRPMIIQLPHPMYDEKSEICFIAKDPQKQYKELLLQKHPVPGITKVIGVDKLRRNYKTAEAKRALADAFDLFLCDSRVAEMMPTLLGSIFYQKKHKVPIPVKLLAGDPRPNLEKSIKGTPMRIPAGPCLGIKVGRCSMSEEQLVENATAVIAGVVRNVRGNPVQAISIQATDAPALPVWRRPPPPGGAVDLKKYHSDASSSAASETGVSGASETQASDCEMPSDAGDTISTRDTVSEPDTSGDLSMDSHSELESDAQGDLPLLVGLKKKLKRRHGGGAAAAAPPAANPAPKRAGKKAAAAAKEAAPPPAAMGPPLKKAKKAKASA